ncbi:PKD domain-containing protein [Blastococcus sp. SYSU DS0510]
MRPSARQLSAAFCLLLAVLLLGVFLELLPAVLPDVVASLVARNSEGVLLALLLVLWVQYARPRLARHRRQWPLTALAAVVGVAIGLALLASDLPSRMRTLNEALLAAALLVPYLQLRRPLPARLAGWLSAGALVLVVAFNHTGVVTDLAEALWVFILALLAFDVIDHRILDPAGRTSAVRRAAWYGALVVTQVLLTVLQQVGLPGVTGEAVLSVWSDKGSSARQFTAPQGVTERSNLAGGGRGDVATLVADSGAPVPAGSVGGVTATVPTSSSRATMLTLLLQPASGTANQAPAAVISSSCAELTCSFDAAESTDPDGGPLSYAWDFGDGATSTEAAPVHTYAAAGEYTVALTVTDAQGAADGETATVTVTAAPVGTGIGLRGSAGVAARPVTAASVDVPDSVRAGDGLVLVLSTNSAATGTAPEGWTPAGGQAAGTAMTTQVFTRVATASDAGSTVEVSVGTWSALTLQLMAYSGTAASGPVASVTGAADGAGLTAHTTPVAEAAAGSWVLSIWSDKGPEGRQFTPPAELSERSNIAGAGNGDVATLVADSGAPVGGGPVGGLTATVSAPSSRAVMLTVVLAADEVAPPAEPVDPADPGDPAEPVGSAPEAVLTSTCAGLTCEFDGSASSDADGPVTSWAWDLGDGTTATGPVVEHAYAAAGDYLVSLTVTDASGGIGTAEATVTVAPAPVGAGIGLRGSAGVAARPVTEVAVEVPAAVRPGDGLVLVLSTNSAVTGTPPAGWALSGQQADATAMTTQVFSRVAAAGDAGSVVTVDLGGTSSAVTLQLLAYSGTAATGPVASVTGAAGGWSPGTAHTTPVAEAAAGSWVLSIWSDKGPEGRQFTPPAELSERSNIAGAGNGDVATLVADSGAPVGGGPVGGLTATVSAPSSRAVMLTVVLAPVV